MIDQPFRRWLASRSLGLVKCYRILHLTPNAVTLLGCAFGFAAAFAVAMNQNIEALILWWIGRLFDGTDGIYARAIGQVSDFGGFLDILADMAAYSAMVVGFAYARAEFHWWWMAMLFLYVLCITGALALGALENRGDVAENDNRSLRLAAGLAEGGETGIAYTLLLLFPGWTAVFATLWVAVLTTTVIARTLVARKLFAGTKVIT